MGRKVYVTSDMSNDEKLIEIAELSSEVAVLWPWFLTALDDWARAEANPRKLKAKTFPMFPHVTVELVEEALRLYSDAELIILYTVNGKQYMAIPSLQTWYKWQTHIKKYKREKDESRIPPPPNHGARECAEVREGARDISLTTLPPYHPTTLQKIKTFVMLVLKKLPRLRNRKAVERSKMLAKAMNTLRISCSSGPRIPGRWRNARPGATGRPG